jgi:hypothetical protein
MMARWICTAIAVGATFVLGCVNPRTTRLPDLYTRDPRLEIRSLARFDPFPDPELGPDTQVRPRGFETERTMPRRNYEERLLQGAPPEFGPAMPPPTSGRYPQSLQ